MRVCLATEERFISTSDGRTWSSGGASYSFLQRYLGVFDNIRIIARVAEATDNAPPNWKQADGPQVTFGPIPNYVGPYQYLRKVASIQRAILNAVGPEDAIILRVGSQIANSLKRQLKSGRPYALEVIGDPYNVFAPGATSHPLRPFWRWWFTRQLRVQCQQACAVCYVTDRYLQQQYPPAANVMSTSFINMELGEDAFINSPRSFPWLGGPFRIITIGSLEQPYKGVDVLIEAVTTCTRSGNDVQLVVIGDGRYRLELQRLASVRGLDGRVKFLGMVPAGQAVRDQLDRAHLFVLASRTEGMPRALIEAMAWGLPCIGSAVGGIPELLLPEEVFPCGDAVALAGKIREVFANSDRLSRMSAKNVDRARQYSDSVLNLKRQEFLNYLFRATDTWLNAAPR